MPEEQADAASPIPTVAGRTIPWRMVFAALWSLVILALCWLPARNLPTPESGTGLKIPHLDKVVHFGLFAVLAALCGGPSFRKIPIGAIALYGVALAILSEVGQAMPFVRRDPGVADASADILGFLAGLAIVAWFWGRGKAPRS